MMSSGSVRYLLLPALQAIAIAGCLKGGAALWSGAVAFILVAIVTDCLVRNRDPGSHDGQLWLHEAALWTAIILAVVQVVLCVALVAPPESLAAIALDRLRTGADAAAGSANLVGAVLSTGFLVGCAVGSAGHELAHRRSRGNGAYRISRWAHALTLYANLPFHHTQIHHRQVGTAADYASVRRGMSFWRYLPAAVFRCQRDTIRQEAVRLRGLSAWRRLAGNAALRGLAMNLTVLAGAYALGGWRGLIALVGSALVAIVFLEVANYVAHYGLVRGPNTPIRPVHSWSCYRPVTACLLFNLPLHASHHKAERVPFWRRGVVQSGPVYPFGLSTMSACALVPPLWFALVHPLLDARRRDSASSAARPHAGTGG